MVDLISSDAYKNASKDILKKICNGVGPTGILGWFIPETIWGLNITPAADIHDFDYEVGVTEEDKKIADDNFLTNQFTLIKNGLKWKWLRRARIRRANFYHFTVKVLGVKHFGNKKNFEENSTCLS